MLAGQRRASCAEDEVESARRRAVHDQDHDTRRPAPQAVAKNEPAEERPVARRRSTPWIGPIGVDRSRTASRAKPDCPIPGTQNQGKTCSGRAPTCGRAARRSSCTASSTRWPAASPARMAKAKRSSALTPPPARCCGRTSSTSFCPTCPTPAWPGAAASAIPRRAASTRWACAAICNASTATRARRSGRAHLAKNSACSAPTAAARTCRSSSTTWSSSAR